VEPGKKDFTELLDMHPDPLATLPEELLRPPREALDEIMESLR
jgi:hypothetical protein